MYEMMSHRLENIQYGEKAYMNMYEELRQNEEDWEEVRSGSCIVYDVLFHYPYLSISFETVLPASNE